MGRTEELFQKQVDYKALILKLFRHKKAFIISAVIALIAAFVFNKFSAPVYTNQTTMLLAQDKQNAFLESGNMMQGIGLFQGNQDIENEMQILKSFSVVNEAIKRLNLEVSYYLEEPVVPKLDLPFTLDVELYKSSPITVVIDQTHPQVVGTRFYIDPINDTTFRISVNSEKAFLFDYGKDKGVGNVDSISYVGKFHFGELISEKYFRFTVLQKRALSNDELGDARLFFTLNHINYMTLGYMRKLNVETVSQNSSFVNITFSGTNSSKVTDFLNTLTQTYLEQNLDKKNRIALNTINFIDSQIQDVSDSLTYTENKLQSFRSAHKVMDLDFQGQKIYEQMNQLQDDLATLQMKRQYYDYIKKYFKENEDVNDLAAPSAMNINDVQLNTLINQLMTLNSERNKIVTGNAPKNLYLKEINTQIKNLKNTILENIDYNYNQLDIAIQDINGRMTELNKEISRMPRTERELFGIERKFKLNDAIYTFLLQKKAEAQIARASNAPDYEVIDEAKFFMATQIAPKTNLNYLIALFLGLLIPLAVILIRDFFNNKLEEPKDVEALTDLPIIGNILNNKMKSDTVIKDYPKSPIADSFRAVRTNLNFFAKGKEKLTILVTSSISGDGKSFCATNLASVYALFGKKTLLVGFDLRKPGLHLDFELANDKGITSYLINEASISEIIQPTPIKNLDFIAAGPTPPNPMELIASDKTKELFENLKNRYDYIIIDSSPIGAVADSFLLVEHVDVSIFVTRLNYTIKDLISENLKNIERKNLTNFTVLINDLKLTKTSYGYVYHSKYYQQDTKTGLFGKLFGKKKKKRKKRKTKNT